MDSELARTGAPELPPHVTVASLLMQPRLFFSPSTWSRGCVCVGCVCVQWGGDIDELYVFTISLSSTTVAAHFAGNFYGATNVAMWLRFSEGTGTTTADSSVNAITLTSSSSSMWRSGETGTGKCHSAYWLGYRVERQSDASLPIGAQAFFTVHQADNCRTHTDNSDARRTATCICALQTATGWRRQRRPFTRPYSTG